jgi:hypothetical protein
MAFWTRVMALTQQQAPKSFWRGGQGVSPNEQNTQQSPGFGRNSVLHPTHSKKYKQALVGISSTETCPHCGHVILPLRLTGCSIH